MGARIRSFDWAATSIGPPERWPTALRVAINICLHSSLPTAIYWGPELRLIYNDARSEEHTSELQSLMRISYAVFCLKKKNTHNRTIFYNSTLCYTINVECMSLTALGGNVLKHW